MRHLNEEKEVLLRFYRKKFALADATLGRRRMSGTLLSRYSIKIGEKTYKRLKKQLGLRTLYPHRNTSAPSLRAENRTIPTQQYNYQRSRPCMD